MVTATNTTGSASETSTATPEVAAIPAANTSVPGISGTAHDGSVLSATGGTWTGAPTPAISYQWQRCSATGTSCSAISGATASTYALAEADVGHELRLTETGSNSSYYGGGEASGESPATSEVAAVAPASTGSPSISGTAQDGSTLSATGGTWSGDPSPTLSYQWERCDSSGEACASVSGATSATYALGDSDVGHVMEVVVTATNVSYYGGGEAHADASSGVVQAVVPANTVAPTISGTAKAGSTLTATNGTWTGAPTPTYAYQWQRDSGSGSSYVSISGATSVSYVLGTADVGYKVRVVVIASNTSYTGGGEALADSQPSGEVEAVSPTNTVAPAISGTPQASQALTVSTGTWTGTSLSYSYAWYRCQASVCTAISGTTTSSYTLGSSDVGTVGSPITIEARVTASNSGLYGGGEATSDSSPTSAVKAVPASDTTAPSIVPSSLTAGEAVEGLVGAWAGTPAPALSYQWQRCSATGTSCSAISGATALDYTTGGADVGHELRLVVTASNTGYTGGT